MMLTMTGAVAHSPKRRPETINPKPFSQSDRTGIHIRPNSQNNQENPMTFAYFSILIFALINSLCSLLAKKSTRLLEAEANHEPRRHRSQASGKAARLFAAEQNGYEMLAAVIIAHVTGEAAQSTINTCPPCSCCCVPPIFGHTHRIRPPCAPISGTAA